MRVNRRCRIYSEQEVVMSERPVYVLIGPDPKDSRAHIVHEKRGGQVVFVWQGFPEKNSTRMKLYPKGLHYTHPLPDGINREPFVITSSELRHERGEDNTAARARIDASRAAISAAVAPKKPEPPTPAPGGDYVQMTLFGYKNI